MTALELARKVVSETKSRTEAPADSPADAVRAYDINDINDQSASDDELRRASAVIDGALSAAWLRRPQRKVLFVFEAQVQNYHARRDPELFGAAAWVEAHVERWRAARGIPWKTWAT
jgi:hypothetical protein